ncbi:Uma2 family endonuclease [Paraburkholderia fungorum]|uniref:Uma2 family endonuclease n=1 Tax=Paraburkholderia fungorum TaxID=134537 RepID=UPI0038BAF0A8
MDALTRLDRERLLVTWRSLAMKPEMVQWYPYELNECGEIVTNPFPSARRQIVLTDVYVQLNEQLGHLAAMSVAVTTLCFGIMVPDVVWMSLDKWEGSDRDDPVPFVPDLCVEVLLDSERRQHIARRVNAYLEGGAREVIVVSPRGQVEFWRAEGQRQVSMFDLELSLDGRYFEEDGAIA